MGEVMGGGSWTAGRVVNPAPGERLRNAAHGNEALAIGIDATRIDQGWMDTDSRRAQARSYPIGRNEAPPSLAAPAAGVIG